MRRAEMKNSEKIELIKTCQDIYFDKFINDPNENIRAMVARYGRYEDRIRLMHDESYLVRLEIIKRGEFKIIRQMLDDSDDRIRAEIVRWSRDTDEFLNRYVHDPSERVRLEVARWGREQDLKELENDISYKVRYMVQLHASRK